MKKKLCSILVLFAMLTACAQQTPIQSAEPEAASNGMTWQEQYDLGMRYLTEGNYAEAIIAFTAAIEIDPKQALAFVGRGQAYSLSGETEENLLLAQTDFETAIELDASNPEAWLGLADIFISRGDYDEALEILQRGIEVIEGNVLIVEKINEIEALIGDTFGPKVEFENLTIRIKDSRSAAITVSGLSLKDSYLTNMSSTGENVTEYSWEVDMYGDQETYSVSTSSWAFAPGEEAAKSPAEMQHSVWIMDDRGWWSLIGDAEMNYTSDSITWSFSIPDEYAFDFANVNRYEVKTDGVSMDMSIHQVYTLD